MSTQATVPAQTLPTSPIEKLYLVGEGFLHGTVIIARQHFHANALRVRTESEGHQVLDSTDETAGHTWEAFVAYDGASPFETIKVPGHPGDWVLIISPYQK